MVHGDGGEVLAKAPDASFDLVVLDAERPAYVAYWPHLRRVLAPYGLVAVDNAVSHRAQLAAFDELVRRDGASVVQVHGVGDGLFTAVRRA
ncbi:hypothetical protein ABZX30_33790 [Streptomyces sp. NPDC004542]|uniref:hypothetical protein n=1 Tax=Streptomyces sp. NPDC004542 TaxID=3154281 RepID=UPI0033B40E1A